MSKEEFLKIQKCVLKVNIHCDGCKHKVKKILQKIDGVFTTEIDAEQGKVTVTGNVDASVLIKKLLKSGKHAEVWGGQPGNNKNQQNNIASQMKNMQIDNAKGGNIKGQNQKGGGGAGGGGGGNGNNLPKGGQGQVQGLQPAQLQQLQAMKGFQDLKLPPQFNGLKLPVKDQNPNQAKAGKFNLQEGDDLSDEDDYDDYDDEDDYDDDDEFDDDLGNLHLPPANKMKPMMGNGQIPKMMMNGNHPAVMNGPAVGGNGGGNGKKGGGAVPVQGNNNAKNGNGGGGKGNGGGGSGGSNQKQGGGGGKNNGGGGGGGVTNQTGHGGGNGSSNGMNSGQKAAGGANGMGHDLQSLVGAHGLGMSNLSQMGNMGVQMGQMGDRPMGQIGNIPAVQGLPAAAPAPTMNGGSGGGRFSPLDMAGHPYQQNPQYIAQMMNQQQHHALGHQPMMYARPPPAVNYVPPPYPYPPPYHPYPPPQPEPYTYFSDENPSSCHIM
ncbi:heavy metal-associated isoprenylated plant protein 32-like [Cucurbita moschata]|uniref:Heavy metal-associated isoprenylated plant protein 32-like n=1 Tax=Cucurbita moschata TaxID=3662 RepID=A0A6J1GW78_CUCMO|nr:heavy metal-associated isoprenylated plant protein 32-like [Cucurbita moschata]